MVNAFDKDDFKGKVFQSKSYGDFIVIAYDSYERVSIKFIATGFESTASAQRIRRGGVKDKLLPSVYGAGYLGDGEYKPYADGRNTKAYAVWNSVLQRCYDANCHEQHPTYKECIVCEEWLNFQVFAKWFEENYIEGCDLDKDIKVKGNKTYSPEFCKFATPAENAIEANAKHFIFTNPEGDIVEIYNLTQFCKDNNLTQANMSKVHLGKAAHHKNWRAVAEAKMKDYEARISNLENKR